MCSSGTSESVDAIFILLTPFCLSVSQESKKFLSLRFFLSLLLGCRIVELYARGSLNELSRARLIDEDVKVVRGPTGVTIQVAQEKISGKQLMVANVVPD